jgi:hypothetical protein
MLGTLSKGDLGLSCSDLVNWYSKLIYGVEPYWSKFDNYRSDYV